MRFSLIFCLLLALAQAPGAAAQSPASSVPADIIPATPATSKPVKTSVAIPPEKSQPVRLPRFESAPTIDGQLDDAAWQGAAVFKDFYQIEPGDNIAPSQPTEVLAGYDAKFLYFAFKAFDEPAKVRATIAKRDGIGDDDVVGLRLDTFNDQRKAYQLLFNPFGIQSDAIYSEGSGEDESFDLVLESKGQLTGDGYVVEIAIPFKSLRYEAGPGKLWGIHLFRTIKRFNNETSSWMPLSRDISGNLVQAGKITGLEGISTERTLEIIPSFTISETGAQVRAVPPEPFPQVNPVVDNGRFVNRPVELDFGVTTKFGLTPTVTLDFAYNPDFAQVEADQTVVQVNQRFPIFFAEKRPFFLEGKEIFDTNSQVVHTRAIIDPDYALKLTGKRGRNSFGLILASDNAPGNFSEDERTQALQAEARRRPGEPQGDIRFLDKNAYVGVLRLKRDVGKESSVGLFATSYNFIEKHNQLLGFDGRFKLDAKTVTSFEVTGTTSRNFFSDRETGETSYRTGNAFAYSFVYDYTGRHWGYIFEAAGRTRDYRADVGFTRRTNTNNAFFAGRYSTEPNPKGLLTSFRLQNFTSSNYDWQGRHQNWQNGTNLNFSFAHQTFMRIGLNYAYERLFAEEFGGPGAFAGPDSERSSYAKTIFVVVERTFNKQFSGYFFTGTRRGIFDLDFGAGSRFPRVSPAALRDPDAPLDPGGGNGFDVEAGVTWQPTDALRASLDYTKARLTRRDTGLVAFDDNIYALRATYQFTRFTFARARVDYDSLAANVRGQFLLGWTPNPGTALYAGYNDDLNRNGFNPFSGQLEPGFRRNGRTFFIKASYLFRRSF